jgi:hypothetical protein
MMRGAGRFKVHRQNVCQVEKILSNPMAGTIGDISIYGQESNAPPAISP